MSRSHSHGVRRRRSRLLAGAASPNPIRGARRCSRVNRFRLIHGDTGEDLGPLVSDREEFNAGEILERLGGERFLLVNVLPATNENFRSYLVVRPQMSR